MTYNLGSELLLSNDKDRIKNVELLLKQKFKPEFFNKIDDIIIFNLITKDAPMKIISKLLNTLYLRLIAQGINIT